MNGISLEFHTKHFNHGQLGVYDRITFKFNFDVPQEGDSAYGKSHVVRLVLADHDARETMAADRHPMVLTGQGGHRYGAGTTNVRDTRVLLGPLIHEPAAFAFRQDVALGVGQVSQFGRVG